LGGSKWVIKPMLRFRIVTTVGCLLLDRAGGKMASIELAIVGYLPESATIEFVSGARRALLVSAARRLTLA